MTVHAAERSRVSTRSFVSGMEEGLSPHENRDGEIKATEMKEEETATLLRRDDAGERATHLLYARARP